MSKKVNYTDVIDYYEFSMSNVYYEPESREKYVYFDIFCIIFFVLTLNEL